MCDDHREAAKFFGVFLGGKSRFVGKIRLKVTKRLCECGVCVIFVEEQWFFVLMFEFNSGKRICEHFCIRKCSYEG